MTTDPQNSENSQEPVGEPELPEALRRDLEALYEPPGRVPETLDTTVLSAARRHFRRGAARGPSLRGVLALAAAAALVAAVFLWGVPGAGDPEDPGFSLAFAREDLDRSGRVDILDAFLLARRVEEGATEAAWDLSGDGVVDRRDVDLAAASAVQVR